jgi:hypothetical protein
VTGSGYILIVSSVLDYVMPNDEEEADRMDVFHEMMLNILEGKLHLSPIGATPQRILDLGTGTGIWAIDMGRFAHSILDIYSTKSLQVIHIPRPR